MSLVKRFLKDEKGLELSEYAVLIALIIVIAAVIIGAVGLAIQNRFSDLLNYLNGGTG